MKKIIFYILILVALIGVLGPVNLVHADGVCYYGKTDRFNIKDTPVTPPIDQTQCGLNAQQGYYWKENGAGAPSAPIINPLDSAGTLTPAQQDSPNTNYTFLAPLPCEDGDPGCNKGVLETINPASDLGSYLNLMIKIFIGLCAVMAVVMIVIGGIQYMTTELSHGKSEGKERITNAIFGLIIALGSWALLYTINPNLLSTEIKLPDATVSVDLPQSPVKGSDGVLRYGSYADKADWATIAGAPNIPAGATTNTGECTYVGQQACTSTRGLKPDVINSIRSGCANCQIVISGGTESWLHSANTSHKPGSSTVDLHLNQNLNSYITGGSQPVNNQRYTRNGVSYLFEGDHWHAGP